MPCINTAILSKNRFALLFLHTKFYNFGKQKHAQKEEWSIPNVLTNLVFKNSE